MWGTADDGIRLRKNTPDINNVLGILYDATDFLSQEHIYQSDIWAYKFPFDIQSYISIPNLTNVKTFFIGFTKIDAANAIRPVSSVLYEASQSILLKSGFEWKEQ